MTITISYWAIPLIVTLVAFGIAVYCSRDDGQSPYASGLLSLFYYAGATIASLIAWLAWSLA